MVLSPTTLKNIRNNKLVKSKRNKTTLVLPTGRRKGLYYHANSSQSYVIPTFSVSSTICAEFSSMEILPCLGPVTIIKEKKNISFCPLSALVGKKPRPSWEQRRVKQKPQHWTPFLTVADYLILNKYELPEELMQPPSTEIRLDKLLTCSDLEDLWEAFKFRSLPPLHLLSTGL